MTNPILSSAENAGRQTTDDPESKPAKAESPRSAAPSEPERRYPAGSGPRMVTSSSPRLIAKPRSGSEAEEKSSFQRTVGAIRTVMPALQKLLPLLDGNVASVVANFMAPRPQVSRVDMAPVEDGLSRLRSEHMELHGLVEQQTEALKRLDGQLTRVKDTTEAIVQEQRDLAAKLDKLRTRMTLFSWIGSFLLLVSIVLNVLLLMRVERFTH